MSRSLKMAFIVLFIGVLLVGITLTFISLGILNPVPWLFVAALISIPVFINYQEKKHFVAWKDEYSVGIDLLDEDHRQLLNLINKLQTAIHYQTGDNFEKEALNEVIAYTKYHFEREEKMMEDAGYPNLIAHKETHRSMINKVDEFAKNYEQRGHEALDEVASYLKNWLIKHINGTDQEYTALLVEKFNHTDTTT